MLRIYGAGVDVTQYVEYGSVKIVEQLNNRANTCNFDVNDYKLSEGQTIKIYEYMELVAQANSWQAILKVNDTYEYYQIYKDGQELLLDFEWSDPVYVTILSIDHTTKEITLTANLATTYPVGTFVGRLVFAGTIDRNPDEEIWHTWKFAYSITVSDWIAMFNRQVVVETFENQYMREIFGRSIYEFCANDDEVTLDDFQSARSQGGVWLAMSNDTTDKIQGTNSQQTGTSGAGTATWTKTLGATVDISNMTDVRLWHKTSELYGASVTSLKYRVGNDSSNYYEWESIRVGAINEDCWNFENFKLIRPDVVVGTVNLATVDRLQIEVVCTGAIPTGNLHFDISQATAGGITLKNTIRGDRKFIDVRVQYKKPSVLFEDITKLQGIFWYVDYDRDINVFANNAKPAPYNLDDTSKNYNDLSISADISMLKNRQVVRGGEAPMLFDYTQDSENDGLVESWRLDYKPKDLEIYVAYQDKNITAATWAAGIATITSNSHWYSNGDEVAITDLLPNWYNWSYIIQNALLNTFDVQIAVNPWAYVSGGKVGIFQQKTVGIENIDDPLLFDYLFNFNEKTVLRASDDILPKWSVFRRRYKPYQPIRVRVSNPASIAAMLALTGGNGVFDWNLITDTSILTYEEARTRARAEVNAYGNPTISADFVTEQCGLKAGQVIHITDTSRGIDTDFLIQKISRKSKKGAISLYTVQCASTMFGLIEFFQLLLKRTSNLLIDIQELVDIVINDDETISITDAVNTLVQTNVFTAASKLIKWVDFTYNSWSRPHTDGNWPVINNNENRDNKRSAQFNSSAQGEVGFDASTNYNVGDSLYIDGTTMGAGKTIKAISDPMPITPWVDHDVTRWVENLLVGGTTGGLGINLLIKEYVNRYDTVPVASHTLMSNYTDKHDFKNMSATFTADPTSNYIRFEFVLNESTGKISLGEIRIIPDTVESQTQPGIASFSEAS